MVTKNTKERKNKSGIYFHSQNVIWKIGVYIRLSVADGNDVSLSVRNQKLITQNFLENEFEEPYRLYKIYIDDGVSGTTDDERPSFMEMVQDIEQGNINCIVSKMLSRVFRNYSDQGYFLEEYFPRMGVRFITLDTPKIDTFKDPSVIHGYELPLNGIVNDRIAETASMAVRQTFRNMRREGKFQGGFPPYGYLRDPEDKYSFIVDEPAAKIIRKIFYWYVCDRIGLEGIRRKLNQLNIPNPAGYKAANGCKYYNPGIKGKESYAWNARTIKTILQNRTYLGEMIQGRYTVISYKVHKQIQVPQSQWVSVPNRHPPIIEEDVFYKAQELLSLNKSYKSYGSSPTHILSGFLYCADCKRKMYKRKNKYKNKERIYFACSTYYKRSKQDCTAHFIRDELIEKAVLEAIQMQISFVDVCELLNGISNSEERQHKKKQKQKERLKEKEKEIEKVQTQIANLYLDYNKRIITTEEYLQFKGQFERQKETLEEELAGLKNDADNAENKKAEVNQWIEVLQKHKNITELNRRVLEELVDRIYIDQDKNITILFKYGDLFKEYIQEKEK